MPQKHIVFICVDVTMRMLPWLLWLGGLGVVLQTRRSQVRFLIGAHAWAAGQVPC